jgi:hypothetical protein
VDEALYAEVQIEAKRQRKVAGEVVNEALREWLKNHRTRKPSLLDIKPWSFGSGTEHLSQEIDDILAEEDSR